MWISPRRKHFIFPTLFAGIYTKVTYFNELEDHISHGMQFYGFKNCGDRHFQVHISESVSKNRQHKPNQDHFGSRASGKNFLNQPLTLLDFTVISSSDSFLESSLQAHMQLYTCIVDPTCFLQKIGRNTISNSSYFSLAPCTCHAHIGLRKIQFW